VAARCILVLGVTLAEADREAEPAAEKCAVAARATRRGCAS
jgi:hypothetical protein